MRARRPIVTCLAALLMGAAMALGLLLPGGDGADVASARPDPAAAVTASFRARYAIAEVERR